MWPTRTASEKGRGRALSPDRYTTSGALFCAAFARGGFALFTCLASAAAATMKRHRAAARMRIDFTVRWNLLDFSEFGESGAVSNHKGGRTQRGDFGFRISDFGLEESLTVDGSGAVINRPVSSIRNPKSEIRNRFTAHRRGRCPRS